MKQKLNLTIAPRIVEAAARFAAREQTSISQVVEDMLSKLMEAESAPDPARLEGFWRKYPTKDRLSDRAVRSIKQKRLLRYS